MHRFILKVVLFFVSLVGLIRAEDLPMLEMADGTAVSGNVVKVDGGAVVVRLENEQLQNVSLGNLSEESRAAVLGWALPKIFANPKSFSTEFFRKVRSSDDPMTTGGFEVELINNSTMDLPSVLSLQFVVHYLDFRVLWGLDENADYRMVGSRQVTEEVVFDGIKSGEMKSFEIDSVNFPQSDWGMSWNEILAGGELLSEDPAILTKSFLEIRLLLGDETMASFTESPTALAILSGVPSESTGLPQVAAFPSGSSTRPVSSSVEAPLEALVIVNGTRSTGSGFLAEIRGRRFLVTNAHVIAGAGTLTCRTVTGETLSLPNYCFLSDDRDLALIPVQNREAGFLEVTDDLGSEVKIGDPITVFGNEAGARVATELRGRVRGIGPQQVEIDALILEGNSGSPVIDNETGRVVGVVAYYIEYEIPEADRGRRGSEEDGEQADSDEEDDDSVVVRRRFAERIDNADSWSKVSFSMLDREQAAFDEYRELVVGVAEIAFEISRNRRVLSAGLDSDELANLVSKFHQNFDASNRRGSAENRRAFDDLRYQMFAIMDARKKVTDDRLHSSYFRKEYERLNAFAEQVREYLENVRTT